MTTPAPQSAPRTGLIGWVYGHVRALMWLLIAGVGVTGGLIYTGILGIDRLDEEVRQRVLTKFTEHYQGLVVTIDSAQILHGRGIQIRGLRIQDPHSDSQYAELLYIDEMLAACDTSLQELLTHEPHFKQFTISRAKLKATRRADGTWNVASLLPLPKSGAQPAPICLQDAAIEICDPALNPTQPLLLKNLDLWIVPDASPEALTVLPEAKSRTPLKITGQLVCDHFKHLSLNGWFDPVGGAWAFQGQVQTLQITPALESSLPIAIPTKLLSLHDLRAKLSLEYELTNQRISGLSGELPFHFALAGQLEEGRLDDPRLPHPLTDLKASIACDDHGVQMKEVTARCGNAKLLLNLTRTGWDSAATLKLTGRVVQLALDSQLADALNEKFRTVWDKFIPTGAVHANFDIGFDGQAWQHDIQAELIDVSIAFDKFPYRVTGGGGTVQIRNRELIFDTFANAGGKRVTSKGHMLQPGPDFTGWLEVASDAPIPIDERLLLAMDAKTQKIVRSLQPRGEAKFLFRIDRDDPKYKLNPYLHVVLNKCEMRYEKFPYPLNHVQGEIEWKDGRWTFDKLSGTNDGASIVGQGSLIRDRLGEQILQFEFAATDVPLEDDLKQALPEKMRNLWGSLHPSGSIDHLKIVFGCNCNTRDLSIDVQAQKYARAQTAPDARSITLEPSWFPYRVDHVTGAFSYRNGDIELKNIKATHGRTKLAADATCQLNPDGGWQLKVERFIADRLTVDHDLLAALPAKASEALAKLNMDGPLQLAGSGALASDGRSKQPTQASWDVTLDLENGSLDVGTKLSHIHGGVRLVGAANEQGVNSLGELAIDSVVAQNVQLTQVLGPLSIENERILFGAWAKQQPIRNQPLRQVTAQVFNGTLTGDAVFSFDKEATFEVQAALNNGDLARISAEAAPSRNGITGKAQGFLKLAGSRQGRHTWNGTGMVRLTDADIYEVPVMVALLKLLSIRPPDQKGFDKSELDLRIAGEHIYIDRLDFRGDAVTLKGSGEADWQRHINLQFYTMVGRDEVNVPILRPLLGEASRQLMLIQVTGNLDQPELSRKAFPGLNETLQQIFPEAKLK